MYSTDDDNSVCGRMMDGVFENPDDICCTCTKRTAVVGGVCCVIFSIMLFLLIMMIWLATRPTGSYVFQPVQATQVAG